jgi:hypothetical protein
MIGPLVPVTMVPRFTSFVGPGTYVTVPLDVAAYESIALEYWRGVLGFDPSSGSPATRPSFAAYLEEAHDAYLPDADWATLWSTTTPNASGLVQVDLTRRFLRLRVVLASKTNPSVDNLVAITCWAAGSLVRRIPA